MISRGESLVVDECTRLMAPVIQIFAFYVIFHGHYSPGGGFQGGALLAGSVLLQRVVFGRSYSQAGFPHKLGIPMGVIGVLIYFSVGLLPYVRQGNFLEYDRLPLPLDEVWLRNTGILMIEIGVAFTVMGILISIFDQLAGDGLGTGADESGAAAKEDERS